MNIKIIDKKYKVDTIPILRSKWIDLTKSVERIAKEDRWIWFLFVGGLFLGILIMAAFGVYYSGSGFENKNDAYIIYKKDVKNFNKIGFNKTCILFKNNVTYDEFNKSIIIDEAKTVDLKWLGGIQPAFHLYWSALWAALFGLVCWGLSLLLVIWPTRDKTKKLLSEMEAIEKRKAVQEERSTR
jgi:hypothetical protein